MTNNLDALIESLAADVRSDARTLERLGAEACGPYFVGFHEAQKRTLDALVAAKEA